MRLPFNAQRIVYLALVLFTPLPAWAEQGQPAMNSGQFWISSLWFLGMFIFGFYFLVTLPGLKKEDEKKKFMAALKKGDEVMTSGGVAGRVVQAAADFVTLEVARDIKLRVVSSHVLALPAAPAVKKEDKPAAKSKSSDELK
jgi:preprotein translocase subunit YajC